MPFPKCFPKDFETAILPKLTSNNSRDVYRIIKSGTINREAFISTYEEIKRGLMPRPRKPLNLRDPGTYSTSCFADLKEAEYILNIFMQHYPKPIISCGQTAETCGPSQMTKDRKPGHSSTHVDWWIHEESSPQLHFKEV